MVAGRHIRLTAVLVAVVFTLTGFSSSGGSGGGSKSGSSSKSKSNGSGGGCSSSKSKKKSHSASGSSSSPTSSPSNTSSPAHATVVTCVAAGKAEATLRVTSDVDAQRTVRIAVTFEDAKGGDLDTGSVKLTLKARETRTVVVPMTLPAKAAEVKNCLVGTVNRA